MMGNLGSSTEAVGLPLLREGASLQPHERLWVANDHQAVLAAALALVEARLPDARVRVLGPGKEMAVAMANPDAARIPLALGQTLVIEPPANDAHGRESLQSIANVIAARFEALSRQTALAASVERLEGSERLQRALYEIADQASSNHEITEVLHALHGIVGALMYAENFYIALYDAPSDSVYFPYYADTADLQVPDPNSPVTMEEIRHGPTWYVIRQGKPLMGTLEAIGRQVDGPFHVIGQDCLDWLGVPLLHGDEVRGCVAVQSYSDAHHYADRDRSLLIFVAQHIQTALERRFAHLKLEQRVSERTEALYEANRNLRQQMLELQRGERLQSALYQIAELASTTDSIGDLYASVHHAVGTLLYAHNFCIALLAEGGTELTFPYSVDEREQNRQPRELANGLTEYVLRHGTALLVNAPEIAALRASGEVTVPGSGAECWLGLPLVCAKRTVGVLLVQSYTPEHRYGLRDQALLAFVSYHVANALERIRASESLKQAYAGLERRVDERTCDLEIANRDLHTQIAKRERIESVLKHASLHDSLTGLPNRTLMMHRLGRALKHFQADPSRLFAVLFLDLDRFKVINDSVGHLVGDQLLSQIGDRVRACLKSKDVVARLGGDEFGVLLENVEDVRTARQVAKRIINELSEPFQLVAKELFTSASVGIAMAAPHYAHPEELLRDADSAMYRAKAAGRHRYELFDERLRQRAVTLLEVESDLRRGLTRGEFEPHYQPIVRLSDGNVIGYEALMRWRHPSRGLLLPAEFLTVAEESGVSEVIDWQVFEQVCQHANALLRDDTFVSINLSGRHFRNPKLEHRLLAMLADHAVPASHLRIEVTERALLENPPDIKRILRSFHDAGIGIALDDFGTGYSSLSYLHQYPLQSLKIDQSFVLTLVDDDESCTEALVRAILAMANALSLQVVAEGVETESQRETLQRLGCEYGQGFLFSRAQTVETLLAANTRVSAQPRRIRKPSPASPVNAIRRTRV